MRLASGLVVKLLHYIGEDIPVGTIGVVCCMDFEDTDINTYEVKFENGVTANGVREYHLELV